jgi:myo-inositol-1(or 4)-monophosphatase
MGSLLDICFPIMSNATSQVRAAISQATTHRAAGSTSDDVISRNLDIVAERAIIEPLVHTGLSFMLVSEDLPTTTYGSSPEYIVILDPIDGTELALRDLSGAISSLLILSYHTHEPLCSIVSDILMGRMYYTSIDQEGAYLDGQRVFPSRTKDLSKALLSIYAAKGDRLLGLSKESDLVRKANRIHNYGGALAIAQVGAGNIDAVVEYTKGFQNIDYGAALFFAERAGAFIRDLEGNPVRISVEKEKRQKFIVSSTEELFKQIFERLRRPEE